MKHFYFTFIIIAIFALSASGQHFNPLQTSKQKNLKSIGEIQLAFDE